MKGLDVNERINVFLNNRVYTFIKLSSGNILNGYIISIQDNEIKFEDDLLGVVPIIKKEISLIDYSRKGVKDDQP